VTKFIAVLLSSAALLATTAEAAPQKDKPVVAVSQIDDIAHTGQANAFQQMIETAVASTGKFRVIERRVGGMLAEQQGAKAGLYTSNHPGKIGGFEGADYLIEASITTGQAQQKSNIGASIGRSLLGNMLTGGHTAQNCSNTVAKLGVDVKITEADSGQIRYATRINEEQQAAATCGENAGQIDLAGLLRSAADKTAAGLLTSMYPIMIAAVQGDGTMVLNYGESAVQVGSVMAVRSKGAEIRDPATGEVLGNNETTLGLVRITEVEPRFSRAVAQSSFNVAPPVGSIVREATPQELAQFAPPQKGRGR
jgi:curli biogenesis system outer membrane secretion channel CsgG